MKLFRRHIDYSTRMHLRRRFQSVDYRFLAAAAGLAAAIWAAVRYL